MYLGFAVHVEIHDQPRCHAFQVIVDRGLNHSQQYLIAIQLLNLRHYDVVAVEAQLGEQVYLLDEEVRSHITHRRYTVRFLDHHIAKQVIQRNLLFEK